MTYLHYFATKQNADICDMLLSYGADPNVKVPVDHKSEPTISCFDLWPHLKHVMKHGKRAKAAEMGRKSLLFICDITILHLN
jgi:ankyrin repeat protein